MELKDYIADTVNSATQGFNRTFMELKVATLAVWLQPIGFNRTFMELKVLMGLTVTLTHQKFQSHLYGIERSPPPCRIPAV